MFALCVVFYTVLFNFLAKLLCLVYPRLNKDIVVFVFTFIYFVCFYAVDSALIVSIFITFLTYNFGTATK